MCWWADTSPRHAIRDSETVKQGAGSKKQLLIPISIIKAVIYSHNVTAVNQLDAFILEILASKEGFKLETSIMWPIKISLK